MSIRIYKKWVWYLGSDLLPIFNLFLLLYIKKTHVKLGFWKTKNIKKRVNYRHAFVFNSVGNINRFVAYSAYTSTCAITNLKRSLCTYEVASVPKANRYNYWSQSQNLVLVPIHRLINIIGRQSLAIWSRAFPTFTENLIPFGGRTPAQLLEDPFPPTSEYWSRIFYDRNSPDCRHFVLYR